MVRPLRILVVRHGESTWNAEGRWQGQADPPLTERGRDQACIAAATLGGADVFVSSDLRRAAETARILAGAEHTVTSDVGLRERDAGQFSGLRRDEIHRRHPGLLPDDPARPPGTEGEGLIPPPGWEPDALLATRAWAALGRLVSELEDAGVRIGVAVSHSGLIYAIETSMGAARQRIPNLGGRWLLHRSGCWSLGPRQLLLDADVAPSTPADQV